MDNRDCEWPRDKRLRARWLGGLLLLLAAGCGASVVAVEEGDYEALVPLSEQLALDAAEDIPGGFSTLRGDDIEQVGLRVVGDEVTLQLDGADALTRPIASRARVEDADGSGPFRAQKEVLALGGDALVLGGLTIDDPVIWPGSFEGSPVITLKTWDPEERGPVVSCSADERCLVLSAGVDPIGRYASLTDPALDESPVASIEVAASVIELTLASGELVRFDRAGEESTRACGLAETALWEVPAEAGLAMNDPVLVHTLCPLAPGASVQLILMERAAVPPLAPLGAESDGQWCRASATCLWFVPT